MARKTKRKNGNKPLPKHVIEFVKKIERTHKGLGIPFLLQYICFEANVSILWIGVKASGKSTIIESFKIPKRYQYDVIDVPLYQVTKSKLAEYLDYIENKKILLRLTELAQLSTYQKNIFLNLVGTMITSRNFDYTLSKEQKIVIIDSDLVVSAGIQPITYSKMTLENIEWEQFASDRLLKLLLINPVREGSVNTRPFIDADLLYSKFYSGKIKWKQVDTSKLEKMLKRQLTIWRSKEYIKRMLEAFTRLLGLKTVTQKTVNLLYLMLYPYVESFNQLNIRTDLDSDRKIWGAGLELFSALANYFGESSLIGVTKYELSEELDVSVRAIEKILKQINEIKELRRFDIIDVETKRIGKSFKTFIKLGENLRLFFNDFYHKILD